MLSKDGAPILGRPAVTPAFSTAVAWRLPRAQRMWVLGAYPQHTHADGKLRLGSAVVTHRAQSPEQCLAHTGNAHVNGFRIELQLAPPLTFPPGRAPHPKSPAGLPAGCKLTFHPLRARTAEEMLHHYSTVTDTRRHWTVPSSCSQWVSLSVPLTPLLSTSQRKRNSETHMTCPGSLMLSRDSRD